MRKYEAPKFQMISRGDTDVIRTSELLFPIIPVAENTITDQEQSL